MIMRKTIAHNGKTFYLKSPFADGYYLESKDGFFILTNSKGEVNLSSRMAVEILNKKSEITKRI